VSESSEWAPTIQKQLDPAAETAVLCHHGVRSMNATMVYDADDNSRVLLNRLIFIGCQSSVTAAAALSARGRFYARCCWVWCSGADLNIVLLLLLPVPGVAGLH
jgi:hypothetical protein